ncbi:MAG: 2-oxoacid:acceptor oxidoreductase subunit alpha [Chloroflexi bacterium]|nr:2-oxoacid:acceptor oxidoreductase subunit alpha [Chloroflexota bacterium]
MPVDINFMIGGEAGQGVQSIGSILAKALARGGFRIFADQDYESRVRGGHNFFRVRASDTEINAISESIDILIALNKESIDLHLSEVNGSGAIIYDDDKIKDAGKHESLFAVPLERLARDSAKNKLMSNTVALGAALGLANYDKNIITGVIEQHFGSGEAGKANIAAADAGYEYARANFKRAFTHNLVPTGDSRRMLLSGNDAIALGALAAGCKFMAAYPMTPTTTIMEYMASKAKDLNVVVVQPEDEIAAINMIIGASFAGVRSLTATSGGGFCLMVEGIGLAGMTETPIVVVLGQRAGPAIGLPTRTEQGDLEFAIHAAHGEFPRAVLAPATVEDAFWLTVKAFNLAEQYQTPVILITDQHLASSYATVEKFDLSRVTIDRGASLTKEELTALGEYKRHRITESGISPRAIPLEGGALVVTDSDEHDEEGHLIEDAETRTAMMMKRLSKMEGLRREIAPPRVYGTPEAEVTLMGWGSTCGAIKEAVSLATADGLKVNMVHFNEIWPFPSEAASDALRGARKIIAVENNATAQLAHLLRAETGYQAAGKILKFDGRPFSPAYILNGLKREVR